MKKKLTLTNQQAQALYILLSHLKLDAIQNRVRYQFLEVIEAAVFAYEAKVQELTEQIPVAGRDATTAQLENIQVLSQRIKRNIKDLNNARDTYTFENKEIFAAAQKLFDTDCSTDLSGTMGKLYYELEGAFCDVVSEK